MTPEEYNSLVMAAFFREVKQASAAPPPPAPTSSVLSSLGRAALDNKKALALLLAGGVGVHYGEKALKDYNMGRQMRKMQQEG